MGFFKNVVSSLTGKQATPDYGEARALENQRYNEMMAAQDPFNKLSSGMIKDYTDFYNTGGYKFDPSKVQTDPGYAFREKQGMNAIENSAMARGGLLSGNTLKATQDYGQNLASQEYGNAYNRSYNEFSDNLTNMSNMFSWAGGQVDKFQGMKSQDPRIKQLYAQADEKAAKENARIGQAGGILKGMARIGSGIMTGGMSEIPMIGGMFGSGGGGRGLPSNQPGSKTPLDPFRFMT